MKLILLNTIMKITTHFNYLGTKKYKIFYVLPSLEFIVDTQMKEELIDSEGNDIGSIIEYSLGFCWFFWSFWVFITIKLNKL